MNNSLELKLAEVVGPENVVRDEPLSAHTTFRVGGPADYFVTPGSVEEAMRIATFCRNEGVALYTLGCGSNVLVSDAGLRGIVMHIAGKMGAIEVREGGRVHAEAGAKNAVIARTALEAGLAGFEFAAGIPGSIGGAAVMNAGAYGGELRDIASSVTCLTPDGTLRNWSAKEANWGYRRSRMSDEGAIVLAVDLTLEHGDPGQIKAQMAELAKRRAEKQPLDLPSAGSTFKRPAGHFAGKLVQDAGMQGYSVGGAQVSTKHAGFVVNTGNATAADIMQVIKDVRRAVSEQFGVLLEPEIRCWGF